MKSQNAQNLAWRIALLLQDNEKENDDFLRLTLEKINHRLDVIESNAIAENPKSQILNFKPVHSSQEKFANLEELAAEIINGLINEKACPFEPAGKPCDHCAMCNSRGF